MSKGKGKAERFDRRRSNYPHLYNNQGAVAFDTKTPVQNVEFDIAVTVAEDKSKSGGVLAVLGPLTGGLKDSATTSSATVSRIKFTIPIGMPRT